MSYIYNTDQERIALWEKKLADGDLAMQEVLAPFSCVKPEFKKALPDLDQRLREAIFWQGYQKRLSISLAGNQWFNENFLSVLDTSLWYAYLETHQEFIFSVNMTNSALLFFSEMVEQAYWMHLWKLMREQSKFGLYTAKRAAPSLAVMHGFILFCAAEGHSKEVSRFKPLMELWLKGNYPICTDMAGDLVVLTAHD